MKGGLLGRLAPLLALGLAAACQAPTPEDLAARVGPGSISLEELSASLARTPVSAPAEGMEAGQVLRTRLRTLIDRQLLVLEARRRGLDDDAEVRRRLQREAEAELERRMLHLNVASRAAPTPEQVRTAYEQGWNERRTVLEIFAAHPDTAARVRALAEAGASFEQLGARYHVDIMLKVPLGAPRRTTYAPWDRPEELVGPLFEVPVGGLTGPAPLLDGFVVSKVEARHPGSLEQLRGAITEALTKLHSRVMRGAYLRALQVEHDLQLPEAGLRVVADLLRRGQAPAPADPATPAMSFGDTVLSAGDLAERLAAEAQGWSEISVNRIIRALKATHAPRLLTAYDARQRGLPESAAFQAWQARAREREMVLRLREVVLDSLATPSEPELAAHYDSTKQRFRRLAQAVVREVLVAELETAREVARSARQDADLAALVAAHGQRQGSEDGLLRVFENQAAQDGQDWIATAMNAPLDQVQGPLRTDDGWSVFVVVQRQPGGFYGLELPRVRRSVEDDLRRRRERDAFNAFLARLRARHEEEIEIYESNLEDLTARVEAELAG